MFFKIGVLKNFRIFTGKHMCWCLFFADLKAFNFLKKRLQNRWLPVNITEFLKIEFIIEHLQWLLLYCLPRLTYSFDITHLCTSLGWSCRFSKDNHFFKLYPSAPFQSTKRLKTKRPWLVRQFLNHLKNNTFNTSYITSQKGQTYFKNLATFAARFLKCVQG